MRDRITGSTTPTCAFSPVNSETITPSIREPPRASSKVHKRYTSTTLPGVHDHFQSNDLTNYTN